MRKNNCKWYDQHGLIFKICKQLIQINTKKISAGNGNSSNSCLKNPMDRSLVGYSPWGHRESDSQNDQKTWIHMFPKGTDGQKAHEKMLNMGNSFLSFSQFSLVSHVQLIVTPWTAAWQASRNSPVPGVHSNSCPLSRWCHPAISSSIVPFSSNRQSFPASGSLQMSQFFPSGGQSTGVSASTSVLPMNTQDCFALGWRGWILHAVQGTLKSLQTTVQKHQFFSTQPSLQSNSHIHTWILEKP